MSILTASGRTAIAASIKTQPIHLAWGKGNPEWNDTPPAEDIAASRLIDEIGRRKASEVHFCMPDPEGELIASGGRYRIADEATNHLYMNVRFDFADGAEAVIRELGIFIGTETQNDTPIGKHYLVAADILHHGTLLVLEHTAPIIRTPSTREEFSFVVTF